MEFIHPRDPSQRVGGCSYLPHDSNCRVDELTQAMWESTSITPPQFSWISPEQLVDLLRTEQARNLLSRNTVVIDVREDSERVGGHIPASLRMSATQIHDPNIAEAAAYWRDGKNLVIYCSRSLSRAPAATHHLLRFLASQPVSLPKDICGRVERIAILKGGFCSYIQHVLQQFEQGRNCCGTNEEDISSFIAEFDPEMWLFDEESADGQIAHISEFPDIAEERRAAKALLDSEMSDELSFLVEQRCSLSPPMASSMPYIS